MSARAASTLAVLALSLVSTVAAAQPAPAAPAPSGDAPKVQAPPVGVPQNPPTPPPGMVPMFPPGATPPAGTTSPPGTAPPTQPPPQPGAVPPGYGYTPPGYGYPPPGYGNPPGYGYYPQWYYAPGGNLLPPPILPYDEGQTVPRGYQLKTRPVRSLVISGSILFGVTYLASILAVSTVMAGDASSGKQLAPLYAPVIGHFIAIGTAGTSGVATLWMVLDGLTQAGGATLLIVGLAAEEKFLQRAATGRIDPLDVLAHPRLVVGARSASALWRF